MRLDKFLSHMGFGTRSEVKGLIKSKAIEVNDVVAKNGSLHVNEVKDKVSVYGEVVEYREFIYLMMNKPAGVVSATEDSRDQTVIDLLDDDVKHFEPYPVIVTDGFLSFLFSMCLAIVINQCWGWRRNCLDCKPFEAMIGDLAL